MLLTFNILTLEQETNCDPTLMIEYLKHWFTNRNTLPKNKYDRQPKYKSLVGYSFLLNPVDFFKDTKTDIIFRSQYLRLAGRRDLSLYRRYKDLTLDLSFYSDLDRDTIVHNPLLKVQNNKLHFKYEEISNGH